MDKSSHMFVVTVIAARYQLVVLVVAGRGVFLKIQRMAGHLLPYIYHGGLNYLWLVKYSLPTLKICSAIAHNELI